MDQKKRQLKSKSRPGHHTDMIKGDGPIQEESKREIRHNAVEMQGTRDEDD